MAVTQRPERPDDEPFLRQLILAIVAEELGAEAWPEPMRSHLLEIQYRGRRQGARTGIEGVRSWIIQQDGIDCGWLVTAEADYLDLIEIMVMPSLQGKGLGSTALGGVLAEARAEGKAVRLSVNASNTRAISLYERMGFRKISGDGVQDRMECAGAADLRSSSRRA